MSDVTATSRSLRGFSLTSFRAKFVLVVGGAVLVDLLLAGGIALWNVNRLSTNAMQEVGLGLEKANIEYLQNYIGTTVERTDLLLDRYHAEVSGLAGSMQTVMDNPALAEKLGQELQADGKVTTALTYNQAGNWWQNLPGEASAVTVWGYLLDENKQPTPEALKTVRESAVFDLFGPSFLSAGPPKLQMYYIGPRQNPILRSTPYNDQGSVFDKVYPGHNETNWWDFYFPGLYETWQSWLATPAERPVDSKITMLSPYLDGITGKIIVSFFQPLMTPDRKDLNGIVGVDLTLDQLADIVKSVKIAETGFAFLTMSNGNVLAVTEQGEKTLGVKINNESGFDRRLAHSDQAAIASLAMPSSAETVITRLSLKENGVDVPYVVLLKQLEAENLYTGQVPVTREVMSLGFMVPEHEIYASLIAAKQGISDETRQVVTWQIGTVILSLLVVLSAVFAISGRITAGLRALADAAQRLQNKDYSVRVAIPARDEVAAVGVAFNRMAEEISYHTENLENLVNERTKALETANGEISALNRKLKSENLRLGAELDVARQIQMMVLPRRDELDEIKGIDVSGYMEPADEVGGDYFDVLHDERRMKVGIGDVTGHGLESGVLMLMVQSVARALQEQGDENPREFLEVLNRAVFKNIQRTKTDKHLSLAFLDYSDRKMTLSGQHEEVLVLRDNDEVERIDTVDLGFPIGLESDIGPFIATHEFPFDTGDVIVLHTDGVTEAESPGGELFGFDRLCESAKKRRRETADEIKDGIIADLMAHIGTQKIHDDITLVVMKHR
ncbi:SpoIIE family protein phosphatase [Shinella sp.]|uniref:SpoIIE family protein phosphatase n=1 Tax=Shinella sp. TaxID=1870904 RepID=UPI0029B33F48|nr:SpoIIE family protein phosphatase [Shinella sp.]MDX3973652.1 SpoIIE family protein phosphatase [Shinella sp.]